MSSGSLIIPGLIETAAVTFGGISGALHATRRNMDVVGIAMVAVCTGVGGGALRDVLLGHAVPVFLVQDFVAMAAVGAVAGYFFGRLVSQLEPAIFVLDTLLIGVWVVIGAEKALDQGLAPASVAFIGITTAVGGSIIRDVLCREVPTALMPGQWVAAAATVSAISFVLIEQWDGNLGIAELVAVVVAMLLRTASARRNWTTTDAITMSNHVSHWLRLDRSGEASTT